MHSISIILNSFIIYCSSITLVINAIQPWDTPLNELYTVRDLHCNDLQMKKINESVRQWTKCVRAFVFQTLDDDLEEGEELKQQYTAFCQNPVSYKKCWNNITDLLNSCEAKRGDTATAVYFAIYDHTCKDNGKHTIDNAIKALEVGELCELNYTSQICKNTMKDWQSLDTCRRYESQRVCEESAIKTCNNEIHKTVLVENLKAVGQSLQCDHDIINYNQPMPSSSSQNLFSMITWGFSILLSFYIYSISSLVVVS